MESSVARANMSLDISYSPDGETSFLSRFMSLFSGSGPTARANPGVHSIAIKAAISFSLSSLFESLSDKALLAFIAKVRIASALALIRSVSDKYNISHTIIQIFCVYEYNMPRALSSVKFQNKGGEIRD